MRYLPAILFLATGAVVGWHNASQTGSVVVLPFLATLFPSLQRNPDSQGLATAAAFVIAGLLLGVGRVWLDLRERRRRSSPSAL
jgi:p-aminobenzoyl-glutamate transporter AbgT